MKGDNNIPIFKSRFRITSKFIFLVLSTIPVFSCGVIVPANSNKQSEANINKNIYEIDTCDFLDIKVPENEIITSLRDTLIAYFDTTYIPQVIKRTLEKRFVEISSCEKMKMFNKYPESFKEYHTRFYLANPNDSINTNMFFIMDLPYRKLNYVALNTKYCLLSITERFSHYYLLCDMECGVPLYGYFGEYFELPDILDSISIHRQVTYVKSRISQYCGKFNDYYGTDLQIQQY